MQALQDHETVINVINTVVAGTEKFSLTRRNEERDGADVTLCGGSAFHARAPATVNAQSPSENHHVLAGSMTSVLEAERRLW